MKLIQNILTSSILLLFCVSIVGAGGPATEIEDLDFANSGNKKFLENTKELNEAVKKQMDILEHEMNNLNDLLTNTNTHALKTIQQQEKFNSAAKLISQHFQRASTKFRSFRKEFHSRLESIASDVDKEMKIVNRLIAQTVTVTAAGAALPIADYLNG